MSDEAVKPAIQIADDDVAINVPAPRFSDFVLKDSSLGSRTDIGTLRTRRWTAAEIARYHAQRARWLRYGKPLERAASCFGRTITGGLARRLCRAVGVPLSEPADRTRIIHSCYFDGPDDAVVLAGKAT